MNRRGVAARIVSFASGLRRSQAPGPRVPAFGLDQEGRQPPASPLASPDALPGKVPGDTAYDRGQNSSGNHS
jgi:hypothetical protein